MRVQRAICNICKKEYPTDETIFVDDFQIRVGDKGTIAYLHDHDFCSVKCLQQALLEVTSSVEQDLDEIKSSRKKKEK